MTTKQENLLANHTGELIFDVNYSTIRSNKIVIIDIIPAYDFKYRYKDGILLNYPINVTGSSWNANEMYIYNSH